MSELRLLTLVEAADCLRMSLSWLKKRVREKEIRVVPLGRAVRIDVSDLQDFIEKRKTTVGENVGAPCILGGTVKDSGVSEAIEITRGSRR